MRGLLVVLALACAAPALLACDSSPSGAQADVRRYEVRGVVEDVDPAHQQVLIDHEDIPGLMPSMTMSFDVADPALLAKLAAGQRLLFQLEIREGHFLIRDARVLEEKAAPGRAGALGAVAPEEDLAPEFTLTDQDGAPLSLASLRGKTVLLDFIYTHCPGPCPILTGRHAQVQRALAPELRAKVRFVSISVDPERDTSEVLKAYGVARGADLSGWSFLTGEPDAVRDVLKRYGVYAEKSKAPGQVDHVVVTLLIDAQGRVAKRLFGVEGSAAEVQQALEALAS